MVIAQATSPSAKMVTNAQVTDDIENIEVQKYSIGIIALEKTKQWILNASIYFSMLV